VRQPTRQLRPSTLPSRSNGWASVRTYGLLVLALRMLKPPQPSVYLCTKPNQRRL
jgi:hypothetical protein